MKWAHWTDWHGRYDPADFAAGLAYFLRADVFAESVKVANDPVTRLDHLATAANQESLGRANQIRAGVEPCQAAHLGLRCEFRFDRPELRACLDEQVDLFLVACPQVVRFDAALRPSQRSQRLLDHVSLSARSDPWLVKQSAGVAHVQQKVEQSAIAQVQLRALDQPLADVRLVGGQPTNQECALQEIDIAVYRVVRESEALSDLACVPFLPVSDRQHPKQSARQTRPRRHS